jgi:hypothetical protein
MQTRIHVTTREDNGHLHTFEVIPTVPEPLPVDAGEVVASKVAGTFRLSSVLSAESRAALVTASKRK